MFSILTGATGDQEGGSCHRDNQWWLQTHVYLPDLQEMGSVHCGHSEEGIFYVYQSGHRGRRGGERKREQRKEKERIIVTVYRCLLLNTSNKTYGLHAPLTCEKEKFAANCHMYTEEGRIIYT